MPPVIAEPARGRDVRAGMTSAILARQQMFRRALQPFRKARRQSVTSGKRSAVIAPHQHAAIETLSMLPVKRCRTDSGKGSRHGQFSC
jgi:hypothetical protein